MPGKHRLTATVDLLSPEVRRGIYLAVAAALAILGGYGLMSTEDQARWLDLVEKAITAAALLLAARHVPPSPPVAPAV